MVANDGTINSVNKTVLSSLVSYNYKVGRWTRQHL